MDVGEGDFRCFTCSLSVFARRGREGEGGVVDGKDGGDGTVLAKRVPDVGWRGGKGVGGGWDCVVNGDCGFLKGGEERGW